MIKTIFTLALILIASLAITGCKKKDKENNGEGTFTLKGRIMEDCNTPGVGHEIKLRKIGDWVSPFRDVGSARTNPDGTFEMECKNYGSGSFILSDARGYDWFDGYNINVQKDSVVDIGTMYASASSRAYVRIHFTGTYGPNDTFIIGQPGFVMHRIHPIPQRDIRLFGKISYYYPYTGGTSSVGLNYGIGQKDFDSSYNFPGVHGGNVPQYNRLYIIAEACNVPDTTDLIVN